MLDENGRFDPKKASKNFGHGHGLGQIGRPGDFPVGLGPRETAELTNTIQRYFIENTRLGIPVFFHDECLHGHVGAGATSFPQPIGLGATFNPELVRKLFAMTAHEARVRGVHQALTPVVDVAREPRWGRVEETYGEDPYLVVATRNRSGARLSGRRIVQRQEARHRHVEALRRTRPAGVGHELRTRQRVRKNSA